MQRVLPPRGSLRPCSALVCLSQAIGFWLVLWYHFRCSFVSWQLCLSFCCRCCTHLPHALSAAQKAAENCPFAARKVFLVFLLDPSLPPGFPPRCCRWPQVPRQSPGLCPGVSCACPPAGVSLQPEVAVPKHLPVGQGGQKPGTMGTIREWLVVLGPRWWSLDCPVIAQHCLHPAPRSISPLLIHTARLGPLSSLLPSFVCLAAAR